MDPKNPQDRLDQATARRLARLGAMPVDTSRLDRMIQAQIPKPEPEPVLAIKPVSTLRALAGTVAIVGLLGVLAWSLSGTAVLAAPDTLATLHQDMVAGKMPGVEVHSIADANRTLAQQWNDGVQVPQMPAEHVMMCCMHNIKDKRVACVLLDSNGVPVTLAVAKAMDMRMPESIKIIRNGTEFHLQASSNLNMIMTERDGRWICLIGALPSDRLIDIASAIQF